jgi:RND family efflux transporter MFP subunit
VKIPPLLAAIFSGRRILAIRSAADPLQILFISRGRMRPFSYRGSWLGVCLVASFISTGCKGQPPPAAGEVPLVQASIPLEKEVEDHLGFEGRAIAINTIQVRAQVSGYLQRIFFQEGNEVVGADLAPVFVASTLGLLANSPAAPAHLQVAFSMNPARSTYGDPLYLIDPEVYLAAVNRASADVANADALLRQRKKAYQIAESSGVGTSPLELSQKLGEMLQSQAQLDSAKASLQSALTDYRFATVSAKISGRIGSYEKTVGNLITKDATVLTTIVGVDPIWVNFQVDDNTMLGIQQMIREGKIKTYSAVRIPVFMSLPAIDGGKFPHEGVIDFVDNKVQADTGTITVRARFDNPLMHGNNRLLTAGVMCRVRVPIGSPQKRLMVAERALGQNQGEKFVLCVSDKNEVQYRAVKVGRLDNGFRAILEGITRNDKVIVNGLTNVRPGIQVRVEIVPMPDVSMPAKDGNKNVGVQK